MDTPVKWYSSGMFARLGFSIASHTDPQVLIVDEVLSVGDFGFQRRCLDRMMHFRTLGVTTVFVSHNMQSVSSLCDRTLLLKKGEVVKIGPTDDIITEYLKGFKSSEGKSDRMISLEKGHLADEKGVECTSFKSGQKAVASVDLNIRRALTNVIVTFSVRAKNGMHIFGTDSMRLTGSPVNAAENKKVSTSIELTLNLVPGEYEIGTSIFDRTSQKTIYKKIFSSFVIQNNYRCGGIAYLDPRIINQKITNQKR
jgi:ABC-type multidrug transport system ATPase subunit